MRSWTVSSSSKSPWWQASCANNLVPPPMKFSAQPDLSFVRKSFQMSSSVRSATFYIGPIFHCCSSFFNFSCVNFHWSCFSSLGEATAEFGFSRGFFWGFSSCFRRCRSLNSIVDPVLYNCICAGSGLPIINLHKTRLNCLHNPARIHFIYKLRKTLSWWPASS